jgi:hypothetical protein
MELSSSWEANSCLAPEQFPNILLDLEVYCRVDKSPPLVPILIQIQLITIPLCFSKSNFNIR